MSTSVSGSSIERWSSEHARWAELMALPDVEELHLEDKVQDWHLGIYTLVALFGSEIAGVLRFWTQMIGFDEDKPVFVVDGEPAVEAKVVTLDVLERFRRRGIGRGLNVAASVWARELGCYQLRSRSDYSRTGNHGLKAALGFGISPGRNRADGPADSAFFVLPLRVAFELFECVCDPTDTSRVSG